MWRGCRRRTFQSRACSTAKANGQRHMVVRARYRVIAAVQLIARCLLAAIQSAISGPERTTKHRLFLHCVPSRRCKRIRAWYLRFAGDTQPDRAHVLGEAEVGFPLPAEWPLHNPRRRVHIHRRCQRCRRGACFSSWRCGIATTAVCVWTHKLASGRRGRGAGERFQCRDQDARGDPAADEGAAPGAA